MIKTPVRQSKREKRKALLLGGMAERQARKEPTSGDSTPEEPARKSVKHAGMMDTSALYNQKTYSDITLSFSGRSFNGHKAVLCGQSEYFLKAIGPDSEFKESKQAVFELQEDNPDALETMLRYIYKGVYETAHPEWEADFEVAIVADKYGMDDLKARACSCLKLHANMLAGVLHTHTIDLITKFCAILARSADYPETDGKFKAFMEQLCDDHCTTLIDYPDFRKYLEENPEMKISLYKNHLVALSQKPEFKKMLKEDGEFTVELFSSWMGELQENKVKGCTRCGTLANNLDDSLHHRCSVKAPAPPTAFSGPSFQGPMGYPLHYCSGPQCCPASPAYNRRNSEKHDADGPWFKTYKCWVRRDVRFQDHERE